MGEMKEKRTFYLAEYTRGSIIEYLK
jgi:hypothetical protein